MSTKKVRRSGELTVRLPELHPAQERILESPARFNVVACGRRFGKTTLGINRLVDPALHGFPTAWFAPTYKELDEPWRDTQKALQDVIREKSQQAHRLELISGGTIDFWSLENFDSVRGRDYKRVVVDEAAKVKNLHEAWNAAIRPTLTDYRGDAYLLSTPRGRNFFWNAFVMGEGADERDWASWRMPTAENPYIHVDEIESLKKQLPERVFRQEILAEFLDDAGGVFRGVDAAVDKGRVGSEEPHPDRIYVLGVDLARVEDFTVLSVVDDKGRQVYFERFNQISWERQIAAITSVAKRYDARVYVDSTGVGDPIYERLRRQAELKVFPYQFTNASKEAVIDNLAMLIEQGRVRLIDIPAQTNELKAFAYELTPSRNVRMSAPEGMHDDCVIALSLACYGGMRRQSHKVLE